MNTMYMKACHSNSNEMKFLCSDYDYKRLLTVNLATVITQASNGVWTFGPFHRNYELNYKIISEGI